MHVEHELDQRMLQPGAVALRDVEAAAGDFRAALEVEDLQLLAQIVVGLHVVGNLAQVVEPLAASLDVLRLVGPDRHRLVGIWGVRAGTPVRPPARRRALLRSCSSDLTSCERSIASWAASSSPACFSSPPIVEETSLRSCAKIVATALQLPPLLVNVEYPVEVHVDALVVVERLANDLGVLPDELSRQHLSTIPRDGPKPYRSVGSVSSELSG